MLKTIFRYFHCHFSKLIGKSAHSVTFPNIHLFYFFSITDSNKLFFIWLLTTPPHLKYLGTLPCNLSLMVCFADISVSPDSVATYARRGWIFDMHLTTNLPRNLPLNKNFLNRLRIDRIMVMSQWPLFWPTLYCTRYPIPVVTTVIHLLIRKSAGFWSGGQCPLAAWGEENFENLTTKWCIMKYIWIMCPA